MEERKFIKHVLLFIGINLVFLTGSILIIQAIQSRYSYKNWETESDLLVMPKNKPVDLLLLGTSHSRIFSRDKNHQRVENILNKSMINLGKGGGSGGLISNLVVLKTFYAKGNSAKQIVYFIDSWQLSTSKWNEKGYFLSDEPLDFDLLRYCIRYHVDKDVLINYFKSKYTQAWLQQKPGTREINDQVLKDVDPEAIQKRLASLYLEPYDEKLFSHYAALLEDLILTAKEHNSKLVFIFPSTLLDDTRGKDKVVSLLREFQSKYGIPFYDYSNAITDYHYYCDHDHLNTRGVVYFTEKFLKPLMH
jgi:hypothetical protein